MGQGLEPEDQLAPPLERVRAAAPADVPVYPAGWHPEGGAAMEKPPPWAFDAPFVRGFAIGLHGELPELPFDELFREIKGLGATHVSLVVAWTQANVRAIAIRPHQPETVPDEELRSIIRKAHAAGLEVMLFPIVQIDRTRSGEWRGKLQPVIPSRWWASYRHFVSHYAAMAEQEKVGILSVGSELLQQESEQEEWVSLIGAVRKVTRARLTYSANWDHFDHVGFWEHLDLAGITGYFELSYDRTPSLETLRQTWKDAADVIATYEERAGKPLLITEVGYPSQVGAAAHPWDYTQTRAYSAEAQYLSFRAMYEAWLEKARKAPKDGSCGIGGLFVWNWYGYGGDNDIGYTLRGKPASAVIRRWFGGR